MSNNDTFFDEASENSKVKAAIVSKYFWAWAKVIIPAAKRRHENIAYIDLFAGPARYNDGTKSTPLLILEQAVQDSDMCRMLITIFNDSEEQYTQSLEQAISGLAGIEKLKHKPQIYTQEVGESIVKIFEKNKFIPTLFFVDPWGYKGLSLQLINSVLKNWGCDCIFFFNYNRISMGISNEIVTSHMNALFGKERANSLRSQLIGLSTEERELTIVEKIAEALKEMGGEYVLPFRFKNEKGSRTSHHLIFVSKNFRGYDIMKGIMARESSTSSQGVPSFEYSSASIRQPILFELTRPLDQLGGMLLQEFAGKQLSTIEIYEKHNVGKPYVSKNYKDVLKTLESEGKITTNPTAPNRRKGTFGDDVKVTFPALIN